MSLIVAACDVGLRPGPLNSELGSEFIDLENCTYQQRNQVITDVFSSVYFFADHIEIPDAYLEVSANELVSQLRVNKPHEDAIDRFSFWVEDAQSHFNLVTLGKNDGYFGFSMKIYEDDIRLTKTSHNGEAHKAGLRRGVSILSFNGVSTESIVAGYSTLPGADNSATYEQIDQVFNTNQLTVTWLDHNNLEQTATIKRTDFIGNEVDNAKVFADSNTGYFSYHQFAEYSRAELYEAYTDIFNQSQSYGQLTDLVIDLRGNPGGMLEIAQDLVNFSINGATSEYELGEFAGKNQFNIEYNRNFRNDNSSEEFEIAFDNTLAAKNVVVLTDSNSCSASESVINMLKPYVDVKVVGDTTCGKPFGMRERNFCGGALFALEIEVTNANNEADYRNGFEPDCKVTDHIRHDWGDKNDPLISAALDLLAYEDSALCEQPSINASPARSFMPNFQLTPDYFF